MRWLRVPLFLPALCAAGCSLFGSSDERVGLAGQGKSVYLTVAGAALSDAGRAQAVADAVNRDLQTLESATAGILSRALAKIGLSSETGKPIAPESVRLEWRPARFDGETQLASKVTYFSSMDAVSGVEPPGDGEVASLRIEAQVFPWPDKPKFTKHPEVLLAQTQVQWRSTHPLGSMIADKVVEEVLAELTKRLEGAAQPLGIQASTTAPQRD